MASTSHLADERTSRQDRDCNRYKPRVPPGAMRQADADNGSSLRGTCAFHDVSRTSRLFVERHVAGFRGVVGLMD
jgi:hypothetical protein